MTLITSTNLPAAGSSSEQISNPLPKKTVVDFRVEKLAERFIICKQEGKYLGWPSVVAKKSGEIKVVFSGDRDQHVCPYGKVQMVSSSDQGKSWSPAQTIQKTLLDDRDAGIIETQNETEVLAWFNSLAFIEQIKNLPAEYDEAIGPGQGQKMVDSWQSDIEKITPEIQKQEYGSFISIKRKGESSWQEAIKVAVTAPHGPIELHSGRLLYLGNNRMPGFPKMKEGEYIECYSSDDEGKSWQYLSGIEAPREEGIHLCEPHCIETESRKLIAQFRVNSKEREKRFLYQATSLDQGMTWSKAAATDIWGFPPHLLRLNNGWIISSYGKRREPFGQYACVSQDEGETWLIDREVCLASAHNADCGYPCSTQLPDGSILTVFYQIDQKEEKLTSIMGTHWKIEEVAQ